MDRRQKKTREAIFDAFAKILSIKSYSKITVQEIIDEANVGRTTFYAHFETKDALLKEMCTDLFDHVLSDTLSREETHDFSVQKGNTNEIVTHILFHLIDNRRNIMGILTCESGELFLGFFKQYLNKLMAAQIIRGIDLNKLKTPEDFLLNHISSSFIGMVQWWIKNNLKESPEQLAEYFISVIDPALKG
nr:TetR/AcrR family transcriptional regulator [Sedimentibacter sp.]